MLKVAVVRFPGSNCDEDALRAAEKVGCEAIYVWHRETSLKGADVALLPGGFSYGDYLRSGAIARFSPVMQAVSEHARSGGAVVGVCNGFQILCEAHLLPGALMRNAGLSFVSKPVDLVVVRTDTVFTSAFTKGATLRASRTRPATWWDSCPIRSAAWTRSSAPTRASRSFIRSRPLQQAADHR